MRFGGGHEKWLSRGGHPKKKKEKEAGWGGGRGSREIF